MDVVLGVSQFGQVSNCLVENDSGTHDDLLRTDILDLFVQSLSFLGGSARI